MELLLWFEEVVGGGRLDEGVDLECEGVVVNVEVWNLRFFWRLVWLRLFCGEMVVSWDGEEV